MSTCTSNATATMAIRTGPVGSWRCLNVFEWMLWAVARKYVANAWTSPQIEHHLREVKVNEANRTLFRAFGLGRPGPRLLELHAPGLVLLEDRHRLPHAGGRLLGQFFRFPRFPFSPTFGHLQRTPARLRSVFFWCVCVCVCVCGGPQMAGRRWLASHFRAEVF